MSISLEANQTWKFVGQMFGQYQFRCDTRIPIEDKGFHIHSDELLDVFVTNSDSIHLFKC